MAKTREFKKELSIQNKGAGGGGGGREIEKAQRYGLENKERNELFLAGCW